jgi:hypothetical protein
VTFSTSGAYPDTFPPQSINGFLHGYQGYATVSGSFDITFDPTQLYLTQGIGGTITNLSFSVTDPYFGPNPLSFNSITTFAFDGAGTLTLYSDSALAKGMTVTPDITIGINGWAYGLGSSVWYSQADFGDTLTSAGFATITPLASATPLPSSWTMLIAGFVGVGLLARRARKAPGLAAA